ncbi:MAG: hypothetical protein IT426_06445 [Pirellulales bacterium]|nr:hypothetical protein [Pirellulales bacterium]
MMRKVFQVLFGSGNGRVSRSSSTKRSVVPTIERAAYERSLRLEGLEERSLLSISPTTSPDAIWFHALNAAEETAFFTEGAGLLVTDRTADGIAGHLSLPGVLLQSGTVGENSFTRFEVPGWNFGGMEGRPELPVFRTEIAVPAGMEAIVDWRIEELADLNGSYLVWPTQPPQPDSGLPLEFVFDAAYYGGQAAYSPEFFSVSEPMAAGDRRTVAIEYCPFRYDAATGAVSVVTELSFDLSLVPAEGTGEEIAGADALGAGGTIEGTAEAYAATAATADYIIITADAFYEEILPLAQWKQKMGYKTYVAKMSEVGTTYTDVYNFINNAYDADSVKPQYVLLVGDQENVPSYEIIGHPYYEDGHIWHSDYDYARVNGTDVTADLAIGRFSGDTEAQITTMVNKTLNYERNPDLGSWYDDVLLAGQFQDTEGTAYDLIEDRWFMHDIHRAADFLGGDYDYYSGADPYNKGYTVHTKRKWDSAVSNTLTYKTSTYPGYTTPPSPIPDAWKNKADEDISTMINGGMGFVLHRDHGGTGGWGSPSYSTSNVNGLSNGLYKLPITFSINCETGRFDTGDYFGEAWLRDSNGGAVAYTGGMRVSYSGYNDSLFVGIMDGMWTDFSTWSSSNFSPSWHIGQLMNYAKDRVFSGYGYSSSTALLTARMFNFFGDPDIMLRTATPGALTVTHPSSVATGGSTNFTVQVMKGASPLAGALVCISKGTGTDYWVGTTNASGSVTFNGLKATEAGLYDVVVTERNAVPYQGTFMSAASNPPTVATPAAANPATVVGNTTNLSALGADDNGEANLTYTWTATALPAGAAQPTYNANGTNAAKNATATFFKTGGYTMRVTIADAHGLTVTSAVNVAVDQTATVITVSPASVLLPAGGQQQFSATVKDQFGDPLGTQPAIEWTASAGTIATGSYTAASASATVTAASGSIQGTAAVTVDANVPTVAVPAAAAPNPVPASTAALSVLGADVQGEANLKYTWTATVYPAGAQPTFTANGTNAAKNTTAVFGKAGSYTFQVTIADAVGQSIASSVNVTVDQTLTSITITPTSAYLSMGGTQQFLAVAKDQFGVQLLSAPTFVWTATAGTIDAAGFYTAPASSASATIRASNGSVLSNAAIVTVNNAAPTVATPASASPSPVTGATTALGVLGADDGGEANLTYTWATILLPGGAPQPVFAANGTNAAKNTSAAFATWGTYRLGVTIADTGGLSVTSMVWVTVSRTITTIVVAPDNVDLPLGGTQQFAATAYDQFGNVVSAGFVWSATAGSITSYGLYTAPTTPTAATVQATSISTVGAATVHAVNTPPTNILLSNTAVDENQTGAVLGALSTVDPDPGQNFAYLLVTDPTGKFEIVGNTLKLKNGESLDYEAASTVELLVRTTDSFGSSFEKALTIAVRDLPEPPTDILLSNASLDENALGAVVGTLFTVDPDLDETYSYLLVNDPTGKFEIDGDALKLKDGESLDHEATPTVELLLRTTDAGGLGFEKSFTIAVNDFSETLVVGVGDWTAAGLTLQLGTDGKLHVYRTGGTEDALPPHDPAKVLGIDITGGGLGDVMTAVSMGAGIPELSLHSATLLLGQDDALSAGANVTVDGGALNYNGHPAAIGNLLVKNDGQVVGTAIHNSATTISSGTLTAVSIVCDALTIGSPAPAAASASAAAAFADSTDLGSAAVLADMPEAVPLASETLPESLAALSAADAFSRPSPLLAKTPNPPAAALPDSPARAKVQASAAEDRQTARQLALRSLMVEWRQGIESDPIAAELLAVKHPRKPLKLPQKTADPWCARL